MKWMYYIHRRDDAEAEGGSWFYVDLWICEGIATSHEVNGEERERERERERKCECECVVEMFSFFILMITSSLSHS